VQRGRAWRCSAALALAANVAGAADAAEANEPAAEKRAGNKTARGEAAAPPAERTWYGEETLIVDGASIALGIVAQRTLDIERRRRPDAAGMVAAVWYGGGAIGAPAVHYAHGEGGVGAASFGLRLLMPLLSGFVGWIAACTSNSDFDSDCARSGWGAGTLVGLAGTAAFDAGLLAWDRPERGRPKPEREWYGWQLLALDAAGIGLGVAFAGSEPRTEQGKRLHPALATWVGGYTIGFFGGPIVHFAHGRIGTGFASFGARAVLGPLGALPGVLGYCGATGGVSGCGETGAFWGLLGGLLAVDVFDAFVLAHEPASEKAASLPSLYIGRDRVSVGGYW
jgi:hypothetical protein